MNNTHVKVDRKWEDGRALLISQRLGHKLEEKLIGDRISTLGKQWEEFCNIPSVYLKIINYTKVPNSTYLSSAAPATRPLSVSESPPFSSTSSSSRKPVDDYPPI